MMQRKGRRKGTLPNANLQQEQCNSSCCSASLQNLIGNSCLVLPYHERPEQQIRQVMFHIAWFKITLAHILIPRVVIEEWGKVMSFLSFRMTLSSSSMSLDVVVLPIPPTGVAAFNLQDMTLHFS